MTIYKRCQNCQQLYTGARCPACTNKHQRRRLEENEARKLYAGWKWRLCRKNAILQYNAYDIWLLGIGKEVVCKNPVVHHIIERDEAPELFYRLDNLITCTFDSHADIHEHYRKDKAAALERIRRGIETYRSIFDD